MLKTDLNVAAVLSGNRNFEARIHQRIKSNFLASPMLVVAFALAGRIDVDFFIRTGGHRSQRRTGLPERNLAHRREIAALVQAHVKPQFFAAEYGRIFEGDEFWHALDVTESTTFRLGRATPPTSRTRLTSIISNGRRPTDRHHRRAGAAAAGRQRHHRPHFTGRRHRRRIPGRPIPDRQGGGPRRPSTPMAPAGATTR